MGPCRTAYSNPTILADSDRKEYLPDVRHAEMRRDARPRCVVDLVWRLLGQIRYAASAAPQGPPALLLSRLPHMAPHMVRGFLADCRLNGLSATHA